jgi:phosphohistidine phosphatase SixA
MPSYRRLRRLLLVAIALLAPVAAPRALAAQSPSGQGPTLQAAAGPALVLIVRHAEKADNSDDPVLSAAGRERALALAEALSDAAVEHVIVTHRQRTRLTAAPLLEARGLQPEVVGFGRDLAAHVADVAAAVRRQAGKVVLVVGHSNTVPLLVHALGGPRLPDLCDARYAALFAVVPGTEASPARVVVSSVGRADPPEATSCAGMVPR